MKSEEIYARLRELAPSVSFSASRELDPSFEWDGDGPDPTDDGFDAYDVTVIAQTIVNGNLVEECSYLGGSYFKEDEPLDDIGGYLPQMLKEAAIELRDRRDPAMPHSQMLQLNAVVEFLTQEMRDRYNQQMQEQK